jgi:predicted nucleic acid-binding protein
MKTNLIDASAFIMLIKKATVQTTAEWLQNSTILDLTYYEVGNAIWKESTLTKFLTSEQTKELEKVTQTILANIDIITSEPENFKEILEIAKTEKLTFYDSSYIFFAKEKELGLITEDKELRAKAQKHVDAQATTALIST